MKEIKVCFRRGRHSLYDEFVNFPPKGVAYHVPKNITFNSGFLDDMKRKVGRTYLDLFKIPNIISINSDDCDLIHSGGGFMILNKKPWVLGPIEHVGDFLGCRKGWIKKIRDKRYIKKIEKTLSSEYCKKIMPYSDAGKKTIEYLLDKKFSEKIEVVRLAVHIPQKIKKRYNKDRIRLLFVGSMNFPETFEFKGGKEALEAFKILEKKYDVELIIRSVLPMHIEKECEKLKNVTIIPQTLTKKQLDECFMNSDIFLYPSYLTPGMVFLEAMSFNLPIITTDVWANPEIIEDGKNGFLIHPLKFSFYDVDYVPKWHLDTFLKKLRATDQSRFINDTVEKTSILIEDSSLRKKMGKYGRRQVEKGDCSIKERNKKLRRIYEEAI